MNLLDDLRLAWRRLTKAPAFTGLVVLTLGLGLAATTTLFAVFETVVLRPLPYRDAGRLVRLYETFPWSSGPPGRGSVSVGNLRDWQAETKGFAGIAGYAAGTATLQEGDAPERLSAVGGTATLFEVLGIGARHGRTFAAGEDSAAAAKVAVLGHGLWQRRFG